MPAVSPDSATSTILLDRPRLPDPERMARHLSRTWPDLPEMMSVEEQPGKLLRFTLAGVQVSFGVADHPLPWSQLQPACRHSLYWKDAAAKLKEHGAHLLVWLGAHRGDAIARHLMLTQVIAAALKAAGSDALAVYREQADLVVSPEMFLNNSADMSREQLPLDLWIGFELGAGPDRTLQLHTNGMAVFGHQEFEIRSTRAAPDDAVGRVLTLAQYVLDNGPILRDGETVDAGDDGKIVVRHQPSAFHKGRSAIVLEM
jgi:hypothetical protein